MELTTVANHVAAFYRLLGTDSSDSALTEQGESTDEVAYTYLTRGCRNAQRYMLDKRYGGWRKRSASALSWTGTDATTGGQYCSLPSDFLRAYGFRRKSALMEANGDRWGSEVDPEDDEWKGDYYYFRGDQLWLARTATPPTTVYLDYHYTHPAWESDVTIEFPVDARFLIIAEAANVAKEEFWLVGGQEMELKIERALQRARNEAREIARRSKQPMRFREPYRAGNRY
jgi:hypothetical protein